MSNEYNMEKEKMSPVELVFRILLAIILPPVALMGLKNVGCGTLVLMCVLTLFFWLPGQIAALVLVIKEYTTE